MTFKLTKNRIDSAQYEGKDNARCVLWDTEIPGFGVRIYPSNKKAFILSYNFRGRQKLFTIGRFGIFTLDEARIRARKLLVGIYEGIDPLSTRDKVESIPTFGEFAAQYIERYAKREKKSWEEDQRRISKYLMPIWKNFQIDSINKKDVSSLHYEISTKSIYEANRTVKLISRMYNLAKSWGVLDSGFTNPSIGVELAHEESRERFLTEDEMKRLIGEVAKYDDPFARTAMMMFIYLPLRKGEGMAIKWEDIDEKNRILTIPETKNGKPHTIHLPEEVLSILKELPKLEGNPYVFCGRKAGSHILDIRHAWEEVRERAGFCKKTEDSKKAVTLHDLRRTFGSWAAQKGKSLHIIGKVLNHKDQKTTQVYARLGTRPIQEAILDHAKEITRLRSE